MNILYTIVNYITDIVRFPQINVKYLFRTDSHGRKQKFYAVLFELILFRYDTKRVIKYQQIRTEKEWKIGEFF